MGRAIASNLSTTGEAHLSALHSRPAGTVQYHNTGRVVIVTGGCNGIGRAIAEAFSASGAIVIVADIDTDLAKSLPPVIRFHETDVSSEEQCKTLIEKTFANFGGIDVLINNAAIQPPSSYVRIEDVERASYEKMVAINLSGYLFMAKHCLKIMRQQQSGVVVNIASGQGHRTARQVPVYGPLKAANILQAMQWGVEYAREGVRVVSVSPGAIDTPLVRASLEAQGGEQELANRHPLGRIGRPEEIANAVMWLASDDASFVTATDLSVDGGLKAFGAFADPYQ